MALSYSLCMISLSSGRRYSPSGLRLAQSMAEVSSSSDGCRMFTSGKLQNDQMIRQTCRILQPLIHQWNSNQIQPAGYQLYNTTALPPCNVFGNGNSSKEVVTRDHHHANARSTGGNHWIRNAITWVLNGSECLWFIWFWFDSAWVSNLRIWTWYDVVSESASPVVGALTCPYHPLSSLPGRALWAGRLRPWHFGIFSLNWSTRKSCARVIGGYVFRSSDFWRTPRNLSDPRSRSLATGTRDLAWSCHVTFRINRCHKANETQLLAAGLELLVRGDLRTAFAETVCLAKWRWSDKHLETQHTESQKAHRNPF